MYIHSCRSLAANNQRNSRATDIAWGSIDVVAQTSAPKN